MTERPEERPRDYVVAGGVSQREKCAAAVRGQEPRDGLPIVVLGQLVTGFVALLCRALSSGGEPLESLDPLGVSALLWR